MLAVLQEVPRDAQAWDRFSLHHRTSHDAIRAAIQQQRSLSLSPYIIYPISTDSFPGFLENNSTLHVEMNAALGTSGVDLEELDPRNEKALEAWMYRHWQEHVSAEVALGIAT